MDNFKKKIKDLPQKPGVYEFKNKDGEVIYVGKAKNLKSRVGQYFGSHDNRPQLPYLMAEAADIGYTVVTSELESLFLENTLIKKYMPRYNIMLRDDKNYAFITIDYSTEIPQIGYARKIDAPPRISGQKSKIKYFGPYSAAYKIRNTLNLVRKIFPFCAAAKVGNRPCFYYYLHRCPGVCIGKISLEEYYRQLDNIAWFLAGNTAKIKSELKKQMRQAASGRRFETAARLRDSLKALELLDERQAVILPRPVSWDAVSVAEDQGYSCVNLFKVRGGKLFDKENFVYSDPDLRIFRQLADGSADTRGSQTIQRFLETYYAEASDAPREIYVQAEPEDAAAAENLIRNRFSLKVKIAKPSRGKARDLIKLGTANAREYLSKWLSDQAGHLDKINEALIQLKETLGLAGIPNRIECYDISNTQGTNPVGSMVVFEKGLPAKGQYRKFKIRAKKTPDDFARMKEMLERRMARSAIGDKSKILNPKSKPWPMPDLIVIDGGKGQLSAALQVLTPHPSPLTPIPIIGLAKRIEEIFVPGKAEPVVLGHDQPALQLLQRIRDEAHRFGITFHRQLRSRQAVRSALDDLPGIGPKTKILLKRKFGTVADIKKADLEELSAAVGPALAERIKRTLG